MKQQLRHEVRSKFYNEELAKAQRQLAHTDSLLQLVEQDMDSISVRKRIYRDSLEMERDVQGAKIRYIHRKQKEL